MANGDDKDKQEEKEEEEEDIKPKPVVRIRHVLSTVFERLKISLLNLLDL